MAFQSTIRQFMTDAFPGDIVLNGAVRSQTGVLKTTTAANNVIGSAFTAVAGQDGQFVAGGTGVFAGILTGSKEYALQGTAAGGALAPTLVMPNNVPVEITYFTTGVCVYLNSSANIGDQVEFAQADGTLKAIAPGASADSGYTIIPTAKVVRQNLSAAGYGYIELTA